jgi:hypothetical protein
MNAWFEQDLFISFVCERREYEYTQNIY